MALTEDDLKNIPPEGIDPENPGKYAGLIEDLQGNILKSHGRDYSTHLFLKFKEGKETDVKQWIKDFATDYVTSAQKQTDEAKCYRETGVGGDVFANFLLSVIGYKYLGVKPFRLPKDEPFRFGMKNPDVKDALGDPPVDEWEEGYQATIHALVIIADDDVVDVLQAINYLTQSLRTVAEVVHREDGFILRNKKGQVVEHFGFVDGVSQPLFLKRDIEKSRINNGGFDKWDPRAGLDIIIEKDRNGHKEDSYGSYLVYRKLEQDATGFRAKQQELADTLGISFDLAGAMTMGRFADGTPVNLTDIQIYSRNTPDNFNFDQDVAGTKCPFHAHTRKTNPRGDTGRIGSSVNFEQSLETEKGHRIARRGISYGNNELHAYDTPNTQKSKIPSGLLFLCFQNDIKNQFNFMQATWANAPNFPQVAVGPDPVVASQSSGTQKWPTKWGSTETTEFEFDRYVKFKGGEYFFAPSMSYLQNITPVVQFNEHFCLKSEDGKYLITSWQDTNDSYQRIYPKFGYHKFQASDKVPLFFQGGDGDISNNAVVQIVSTESSVGSKNILGSWKSKNACYYWTEHNSQMQWWTISKANGDEGQIRYGDKVYITNRQWNQPLAPYDNDYLSGKVSHDSYVWIIEKA